MKRNLLFYGILLVLIVICFFLLNKANTEIKRYSELTSRSILVSTSFLKLSEQVKNAEVSLSALHQSELTSQARSVLTDSAHVVDALRELKRHVGDSVNNKITEKLDSLLTNELSWIIKSNVPDSIKANVKSPHMASLKLINSLLAKGITRTNFLFEYIKGKMDQLLTTIYVTIVFFILLSFVIVIYTTVNFFRQNARREKKEKELMQSEENLQKHMSELIDYKFALDESSIISITDENGIIKHVNDNFCKTSKYTREELIGSDHRIMNSGYHSKEFIANVWRTIAEGKIWRGEIKNRAKDGYNYWVETTIIPFLTDDGKPYQYLAIRSDITENKLAEERLVKANRFYSFISAINHAIIHSKNKTALLTNASDIAIKIGKYQVARIGLLDKKGVLKMVDGYAEGVDPDFLVRYNKSDYFNEELKHTSTAMALRTGEYVLSNDLQNEPEFADYKEEFEKNCIRSRIVFPIKRGGNVAGVFCFVSSVVNYFDEQEIALLEEVTNNISFGLEVFEKEKQKTKAKEELQSSKSNLVAILENTDAVIYSLDRELRYVAFNKQLQMALKQAYNLEIKTGDNVYAFLEKLDIQEAKSWEVNYKRALLGETVKFEKEFNLNGVHTFQNFSIHPIWDNNEVVGLSCFVLDVTKQREEELHKEKMTGDLIARNAGLEQFSYIVSHNLRAPVANMMGLANLIKKGYVKGEQLEATQSRFYDALDQLEGIITDLNSILHLEKEINDKKEIVVFSELIEQIKSNMGEKAQATILSDFSVLDKAYTIKPYFHSIFYNLISNSIKYSKPDTKPVIKINIERRDGKLVINYEDNGIGIDMESYKDKIFGLYKRFHSHVEGKGMGLFMIKKQVEMLGGMIEISSVINQGTKFVMEFDASLLEVKA